VDRFEQDAIYRAHRYAQFAAGTKRFNHPVHAFVSAINRIGGARFDAQGTAYAPFLVDEGYAARAFDSEIRVQRHKGMAGNGR
jgi:hypothetical protein